MRNTLLAALIVPIMSAAALAQDRPGGATQPATAGATQREWGRAKAGLQLSLTFDGELAVGGKFRCDAALRNVGRSAVPLPGNAPGLNEPFAWLFIVQNDDGGAQRAFYTEKLPLARGLKNWPGELASGKTINLAEDEISARVVKPYLQGLKIDNGYPADNMPREPSADKTLQPLKDVLVPGKFSCRLMLYLPSKEGRSTLLVSNTLRGTVAPPDFAKLSKPQREKFVADLLTKFDRDAWAAMAAHDTAVRVGKAIVPDVAQAVKDRKRPGFSRMWLATALADIRCDASAEALDALLDDASMSVVYVVAYHGPKQRSKKLDKAILRAAGESRDPKLSAYALLGYMVHRGDAPAELLAQAIDNPDPRVQSAVRSALKHYANRDVVARLAKLAKSDDARLAAAARKVLHAMGYAPHTRPDQ